MIVLFGMAAPEVFLGRACYQFVRARKSVKMVEAKGLVKPERQGGSKWTMTHAMFTEMGGFQREVNGQVETINLEFMNGILCDGDCPYRATLANQLDHLLDEINDKSKADPMVKVLACLQVVWFLVTILARRFGTPRLPLTQLEIATCGYIICALGTWSFWWTKPYNVQCPILLSSLLFSGSSVIVQSPVAMTSSESKWNTRLSRATDNTVYEEPRESGILQELKYDDRSVRINQSPVQDPTLLEIKEITESPQNSVGTEYFDQRFRKQSSDCEDPGNSEGVTLRTDPEAMKLGCIAMFFGAAAYSACHLFAWDFVFHTPSGQLLWRICSLVILVFSMSHISLVYFLQTEWARQRKLVEKTWFKVVLFSVGPIYGSARSVLLILVFVAFLNVPPDAYNQIRWAGVVPRIG